MGDPRTRSQTPVDGEPAIRSFPEYSVPLLSLAGKANAPSLVQAGNSSDSTHFWFTAPEPVSHPAFGGTAPLLDRNWLAVAMRGPPTNKFICLSESEIGVMVTSEMENKAHLPDYFGIGAEVAGRQSPRWLLICASGTPFRIITKGQEANGRNIPARWRRKYWRPAAFLKTASRS